MRLFVDSKDTCYVLHLTPHERLGGLGVSQALNAICFETEDGRWIGSVVVFSDVTLENLTRREIRKLLRIAKKLHR